MKRAIPALRVGKEHWEINASWDPLIHPDDATAAIHVRLSSRRERRGSRISNQTILEDVFIESVVNNWPPNQQQKEKIDELSSDKKFIKKLARALEEGRSPTFDAIDIFILRNWRELRFKPEVKARFVQQEGKLPGLRDCSPKGVVEDLFKLAGLNADYTPGDFDHWFRSRRDKLGLRANPPYQIKKFLNKSGDIQIVR
jgi:hypothetical protein